MADQFVNQDSRENWGTNLRVNRINEQSSPTLKAAVGNVDDASRVFEVKNMAELDQIAFDYVNNLTPGNLAILYDLGGMPSKLYSWAGINKWQEVPSKSVLGDVLIEGSTANKGVIQFALHNEVAAEKAIQADDPRLKNVWVSGMSTPTDTSLLWIDTSNTFPVIKWFDGAEWIGINNLQFIDDVTESFSYTYSSKKINKELEKKSNVSHVHGLYENHMNSTSNPHKVSASQVLLLNDYVANHPTVLSALVGKHSHNNPIILSNLSEDNGSLLYNGKPVGTGDMAKASYDKNGTGIIDKSRLVTDGTNSFDVLRLLNIEGKVHTHSNKTVIDATEEVFTTVLKNKIMNIDTEANKYIHPLHHSPSIIIQDTNNRFVTDLEKANWNDKYSKVEVNSLLIAKENSINKGKPGGYASLDSTGKIAISQIPISLKETKVVANMAERNTLTKYAGLRVVVSDTSDDPAYGPGTAEFIWSGTEWTLVNTTSTMDNVQSKSIATLQVGTEADRYVSPPADKTVFFSTDTKKIYLYFDGKCISFAGNTSGGGGSTQPTTFDVIEETIFLPANATIISLLEGTYTPFEDNIELSIDGLKISNTAFNEINDHQIQLKAPIDDDCIVVVSYFSSK